MSESRRGLIMYVARFSYDVMPANREQALDYIRGELQAARDSGLNGRILVPLTRGHGGGPALQFEVELANLDQLDQFAEASVRPKTHITGCAISEKFSLRLRSMRERSAMRLCVSNKCNSA